jgi:rRNA-processing protein FCF1
MRLRHDVSVEHAIETLNQRITDSQQVTDTSGQEGARPAYLTWIDTTQQHLRTIFADTELESSLLSRGYWPICGLAGQFVQQVELLNRLIREELVFQVGHPGISDDLGGCLGQASAHLRELTHLGSREGHICVPDTNALLHYTRFDQLDWAGLIEEPIARLVIPITVVDELDDKKYARREEFQQRARELVALIDRYVTSSPPDGYSEVRAGTTVEVLPDERGHIRVPSNDQEILERCEFLQQMTGNLVMLITGDSGMRIKAQSRGIGVLKLSDEYMLPRFRQNENNSPVGA